MHFESWPNGNGWEAKTSDGRYVSIMKGTRTLGVVVHQEPRTAFLSHPLRGAPRNILVQVHHFAEFPIGSDLAECVAETDRNGELIETHSLRNTFF